MKILYIHQYFAIPFFGGATRSYEMSRRLVQAGHEVTILTSSAFLPDSWAPTRGWHQRSVDGITVKIIRLPYSNKLSFAIRILRFIEFMLAVTVQARNWTGEVVFASSTPLTIAIPGVFAARRNCIPMVFEVRDLWPEIPIAVGALNNPIAIALSRWLEKFAYRNANRIVALSTGMAEAIKNVGYPEKRISVIPNGCDIELFAVTTRMQQNFFDKHPYLEGFPMVAYTGTIGYVNGVEYLIEIAHEMRSLDSKVGFIIAGDGKEVEHVRNKAVQLDLLGNNLWILKPLPKQDVAVLLSLSKVATSLFIDVPQMWNNSANKFFDALAAGRPLMINYRGWQAELLEKNNAGIIVPPNNSKAAAEILFDFLNNEDRLQSAGLAAKRLAETKFNRDKLGLQLQQVLEAAVAEAK